jgi:putative NADH-flavin reductase
MKIALFGANGFIGQRILDVALERGHKVTAVVRDPAKFTKTDENLSVVAGDVTDAADVAVAVAGNDAVISSVGPTNSSPQVVVDAARSLLNGVAKAKVKRLIAVGGAGSLEVAPGIQIVDTPEFPEAWKTIALAHRDALNVYRDTPTEIDWVNISPAAVIEPGEKTGKYRVGNDQLLVDESGQSKISAEDYAVALLDEVEHPKHKKQRITVAY